ncbi:MAG: 6,7-dimethyl-8-ribityllumazine synthase [Muribaculaceae bacterium]|nr:6,7-dimethyl-8-ribityllumazine synthase [Muribaculaceae bacterium]
MCWPRPALRGASTYSAYGIKSKLARGAVETLTANGILPSDIISIPVPGAVELTYAAARVIEHQHPDAVIVFGAVVRGDTPHFDYVCESVTQGVTLLNSTGDVPVIFGLLTVDNEQQALDRIGGPAGHKGVEAAETAIRMIALASSI